LFDHLVDRVIGRKVIFSGDKSMADKSMTGLSEGEAKEFHGIFVSTMSGFFGVVIFAHLLDWFWRPWF